MSLASNALVPLVSVNFTSINLGKFYLFRLGCWFKAQTCFEINWILIKTLIDELGKSKLLKTFFFKDEINVTLGILRANEMEVTGMM